MVNDSKISRLIIKPLAEKCKKGLTNQNRGTTFVSANNNKLINQNKQRHETDNNNNKKSNIQKVWSFI